MGNKASVKVEECLSEMEENAEDSELQEEGFRVLMDLVHSTSEIKESMGSDDRGVKVVISVMERFPDNVTIYELGCGVFMNLSHQSSTSQNAIAKANGIETLINAVRNNESHEMINQLGLGALWNVCFANSDNQKTARECGAVDLIMKAIDTHFDNVDVVHNAVGAAATISENEENIATLNDSGITEKVSEIMKKYEDNPKILKSSCEALMNLSHDNQKVREIIADDSVYVGLLLNALKVHKVSPKVCEYAAGAIWNLCYKEEKIQKQISDLNGVEILVEALSYNVYYPSVCENICGALVNISDESVNGKDDIVKHGGIEAVLKTMKRNPGEEVLHENTLGVLMNISHKDTTHQDRVRDAGGIEMIAKILSINERNVRVLANGYGSLWNLASKDEANVNRIMRAINVKKPIQFLEKCEDKDCAESVTGLILSLVSVNDANKTKFADAGAVEAIVAAMKKFPGKSTFLELAVGTLHQICEDNPVNEETVDELMIVLRAARKDDPDSSDIQTWTRELLGDALGDEDNAKGKAALEKGDFAEAIDCFSKAIEADTDNYISYYNRALAHYKDGDKKNALKDIESSLEKKSDFADGYFMKASLLHVTGKYDDAIATYKESLDKFPLNVNLIMGLSHVKERKKLTQSTQKSGWF